MGKQGPCRHCGVTSTPLWRNGPPEKPVLCNACGSRWRTKGSLANYTPMHARELIEPEDCRGSKIKSITPKSKEHKLQKKKQTTNLVKIDCRRPQCDQNFKKILEEDTSNRSSSGSAISFSESCAHFGTTDPSDLTGSAQSNVLDSLVQSKKRTGVACPKPTTVEMLTKDLYSIWHEQQLSCVTESSDEDLLYESQTPFGSDEIGHGGVLIRHPTTKNVEEESEASSIPMGNESYLLNEAYSGSGSLHGYSGGKVTSSSKVSLDNLKKTTAQVLQGHTERDRPDETSLIVRGRGSPLCSTDLKEVLSFDVFMTHLTQEEQQKLMRYIPSVDADKLPDSIKSMFCCSQFTEACSYYQHLLAEGVFDLSFLSLNIEECNDLRRLALVNLTKDQWIECYKELKAKKPETGGKERRSETTNGSCCVGDLNLTPLKRLCDNKNQKIPETDGAVRSPKRVNKSYCTYGDTVSKTVPNIDEFVENEGSCLSPRSLFAFPPDRTSMQSAFRFTDDNSEQDLLLDVPSNVPRLEVELLCHPWKQRTHPDAEQVENHANLIASDVSSQLLPRS